MKEIKYLTVSYDDSDKDFPAIVVLDSTSNVHTKKIMLRCDIGNEAKDLYRILTDQSVKFKIVEEEDE